MFVKWITEVTETKVMGFHQVDFQGVAPEERELCVGGRGKRARTNYLKQITCGQPHKTRSRTAEVLLSLLFHDGHDGGGRRRGLWLRFENLSSRARWGSTLPRQRFRRRRLLAALRRSRKQHHEYPPVNPHHRHDRPSPHQWPLRGHCPSCLRRPCKNKTRPD